MLSTKPKIAFEVVQATVQVGNALAHVPNMVRAGFVRDDLQLNVKKVHFGKQVRQPFAWKKRDHGIRPAIPGMNEALIAALCTTWLLTLPASPDQI